MHLLDLLDLSLAVGLLVLFVSQGLVGVAATMSSRGLSVQNKSQSIGHLAGQPASAGILF